MCKVWWHEAIGVHAIVYACPMPYSWVYLTCVSGEGSIPIILLCLTMGLCVTKPGFPWTQLPNKLPGSGSGWIHSRLRSIIWINFVPRQPESNILLHSVPFIVFHHSPIYAANQEGHHQEEDLCAEGGGPVALQELSILSAWKWLDPWVQPRYCFVPASQRNWLRTLCLQVHGVHQLRSVSIGSGGTVV